MKFTFNSLDCAFEFAENLERNGYKVTIHETPFGTWCVSTIEQD